MSRQVRTPGDPKPQENDAADDPAGDAGPESQAPAQPRRRAQAPAQLPVAASGLPNAIDIDAKKITAPVLTNQGWVCPDESGQRKLDSHKP